MFFAACGGNSGSKEDQLKDLLKQQAELNDKIRALKEELKKEDNSSIPLVKADIVQRAPFKHFIEVQAKVDGDQSINVSPRSQGTVTSVIVNEGARVEKGQVLATLDDQVISKSYQEVKTQYEFANSIYLKQKNLWEQNIGSEVQYLTAKNNKESLEKRLAAVSEQLDMTRIKAPISGTVDNVNIKVGQAIMSGMTAFTVVNLKEMKVKGEVGESHAGKIARGDDVVLFFPDLKTEVEAKVSYASLVINPLNRTFTVEVPVDSIKLPLSPNMVVVMKIVDYFAPSAQVVPVDLVQKSGEGEFIMIAERTKSGLVAKRKMVKTGKTYGGITEIMEGLASYDKVITVGYRDLNEGQEIRL